MSNQTLPRVSRRSPAQVADALEHACASARWADGSRVVDVDPGVLRARVAPCLYVALWPGPGPGVGSVDVDTVRRAWAVLTRTVTWPDGSALLELHPSVSDDLVVPHLAAALQDLPGRDHTSGVPAGDHHHLHRRDHPHRRDHTPCPTSDPAPAPAASHRVTEETR